MGAYATVEELESRWRPLSDIEEARAETRLADASMLISSTCKQHGVELDDKSEDGKRMLSFISCEMVKRSMMAPVDQAPMSNWSQAAGGYSESATYVNPTGDLYLTSGEKKLLGIGRQRIASLQPSFGDRP
jgi:hypothetical protein|nr:MAG TPA: hypothetical protein [Caudoviricetes sp.]